MAISVLLWRMFPTVTVCAFVPQHNFNVEGYSLQKIIVSDPDDAGSTTE